jgi:hypothetical protein
MPFIIAQTKKEILKYKPNKTCTECRLKMLKPLKEMKRGCKKMKKLHVH